MKVTVCVGSSCHIKGSRNVVECFQYSIARNNLKDKVELQATGCMGHCEQGVCVTVDGKLYSVSPENAREFFETKILGVLK